MRNLVAIGASRTSIKPHQSSSIYEYAPWCASWMLNAPRRKHDHAVRRKRNGGPCRETVQRFTPSPNPPAIADRRGIWKFVVPVVVEHFEPVPGKRQPDRIIAPRLLGQVGCNDHIPAFAFDPSVQNDHAVEIPGARHPGAASAQRGLRAPKLDHVGDKAGEIAARRASATHQRLTFVV